MLLMGQGVGGGWLVGMMCGNRVYGNSLYCSLFHCKFKTALFKEKLFLVICCFKSFLSYIQCCNVQNWFSLYLLRMVSSPVFNFEVCNFSIIPSGNTYIYILVMLFIMYLIFSPHHTFTYFFWAQSFL